MSETEPSASTGGLAHGDLTLTPERWAVIGPKLASLLAELAKLDTLEGGPGSAVEPDTADAWGATARGWSSRGAGANRDGR